MFAGIIVSGAVLALVFLLRIMKPFFLIALFASQTQSVSLSLTRTRFLLHHVFGREAEAAMLESISPRNSRLETHLSDEQPGWIKTGLLYTSKDTSS